MARTRIDKPLATGIRAIDGLLTLGEGQRIAIMAGSGVGKSTLLGMAARTSQAEVNVVCLVGERGREVREFLERDVGPEGLAKSVVIIATSDRAPVLLVKAVQAALSVAEYFRDDGAKVMLMVDSLTRLAMAQRQIGLASGEPPATRGYTPSVFTLLPRLLERAGPGSGRGSITAITTVLVEGDDMDDPVADTVRGIVDGHIVLSRRIASHGHYPAIDVLESVSRTMNMTSSEEHQTAALAMRDLIATWRENEELIRLGAYRRGTDPKVDRCIMLKEEIDGFLRQQVEESTAFEDTVSSLIQIADRPDPIRRPPPQR
jgi:flagellum-specific ATP synthase